MPYATTADMIDRYGEGEVTRLAAPEGQMDGPCDAGRVEVALADASSRIDSYLMPRYAVPLQPVPPAIRAACCILARHALALSNNQAPSDSVRAERDEITAWLKRLAAGEAVLPGVAAAGTASGARVSDRPAMFGADAFRGW